MILETVCLLFFLVGCTLRMLWTNHVFFILRYGSLKDIHSLASLQGDYFSHSYIIKVPLATYLSYLFYSYLIHLGYNLFNCLIFVVGTFILYHVIEFISGVIEESLQKIKKIEFEG